LELLLMLMATLLPPLPLLPQPLATMKLEDGTGCHAMLLIWTKVLALVVLLRL
jgi:hypothetical protein